MDDTKTSQTYYLTYFTCNTYTIYLFVFVLIIYIFALIIIKLFVYSEIYKKFNICNPIFYYWGNNSVCKKQINNNIKNWVNSNSLAQNPDNENFSVMKDTNNTLSVILPSSDETFYNIKNLLEDLKKNYTSMIQFIHSIHDFIYKSFVILIT
jgi:hypothetical protein